jgi:hypothetical protein
MKFKKILNLGLVIGFTSVLIFIVGCKKKSAAETAPSASSASQINSDLNQVDADNWEFVTNAETKAYDDLRANVRDLAGKNNFQELEAMAEEFRSNKSRFKNGNWKLRYFYLTFEALPENMEWAAWIDKLKQWETQYPDSITPRLALAEVYLGYALVARGSDWGNTVTDAANKQITERLENCFAYLREARKFLQAQKDYAFYSITLRACLWANVDRNDYEKIFNEGVQNAPDYSPIYEYKAYYLLPRWYGQPGEWETFARTMSKRKDIPNSEEIFARCAIYLRDLGYFFEEFSADEQSWDELKSSFHAIEKNYPESLQIKSIDCFQAVQMCDYREAREQMKLLDGKIDLDVWPTKEFFQQSIKWLGNDEQTLQQQRQEFIDRNRKK